MLPFKVIISYFIPHIKKYKWSFWTTFIFLGIGFVGSSIITPLFYREIIDAIISAESGADIKSELMTLVAFVAAVIVLYNIAFRAGDYTMVYLQSNVLRELHNFAFQKLQHHSYQFFVNTFQGSLVAKARRFVRAFETLHDAIVFSFWQVTIKLLGMFVVMFIISPPIMVFFTIWGIAFILVTIFFVQKKRTYDLREATADSRVTAQLADAITNVLNIKMFASLKKEKALYANVTGEEERARRSAWYFNNLIMLTQATMWMLLEVVGLYIVITLWINGAVSAGTIVLVQTYFIAIFGGMWDLGRAITRSVRALSEASEMIEIFETPIGIQDPAAPEPCKIQNGKIVFTNVSFTYGKSAPIFENFNLTIGGGEKIGLVGHSGVGKTTITKLLLRFMDARSGTITIDGQDIKNIKQDDLRAKIAYVPQDPILFHRSLRENIAYGKPSASEAEIIDVAKKAHAHEFISALPNGYDTLVGERGIKLSGGERQRVAVARAMLKNAPILILDEATSSLDSMSEKYVQAAFAKLMEGKTTIVVAHRLSTIQKMDRIIVLEKGKIVEEGTHQELLAKKGVYHNFWTHQIGGFIA